MAANWVRDLAAARRSLERLSTAERIAEILRGQITAGAVAPGERLAEEQIRTALGVSRNTLREAFRLLGHERLLVHEFGRGVFVAMPTERDVRDLYRARRALEIGALRECTPADATAELQDVAAAVHEGIQARDTGDWWTVGTANMHFHQRLVALARSSRIDETMAQLLAEMRLVFQVITTPRELHLPYLEQNQGIYELLAAGETAQAANRLHDYLVSAEQQLLQEFHSRATADAGE
ncbi:GntR family transcriptional regulator [Lipingzhangella sp. LS1_29]|uniref:GntR family transcriptional regulator n=1 Tax=Lipingzhangella rawalii TaxID=2055835 RepID=A0ABU2H4C3_9ACTN|nr:GntR family transcriptional regulator [Lipingzhangella rawalii]MDS1270146.1 GntR family transcriptional regulator [Lipingzhangella rawalii]